MWSLLLQTNKRNMYQPSSFKIKTLIFVLSFFCFTFSSDSVSSLFSSFLAGDNITNTIKGNTLVFAFAKGLVVERDDKSESEKERNIRRNGDMNSINKEKQINIKPTTKVIEAKISKEEEEEKKGKEAEEDDDDEVDATVIFVLLPLPLSPNILPF